MLPYNPIIGSSIVLIEPQYQMTKEDKEFDENKSDPLIFTKYTIDMPYSLKEIRNENGLLERIDYFFWVKNRLDSDTVKPNISIITQLLKSPKTYAYVQGLRTNPDRYALLNITGLQYYNGDYQLELMNDKTIRANGNEKPLHHEWKLIRQNQYEKIDVQLWNKLVDSVDAGLHKSLYPAMILTLLNEIKTSQVFLTTHSDDFIKAFSMYRVGCHYELYYGEDNKVEYKRFQLQEVKNS
jgi:hypothetical protein